MTELPPAFANRILGAFREDGAAWLQRLPETLEKIESRWDVTILEPFEDLSYNFVAPARREDGSIVVLKAGVPHHEILTEIAALGVYDGRGTVQLLEAAQDLGAMLLERLEPGQALFDLQDDETATEVAIDVMRQLRESGSGLRNANFPKVSDWAAGLENLRRRFGGDTGPVPRRLVESAESLFSELLGSMDKPVLLHGDLHHWNILSAQRRPWLAIDPKGVIGEPAYEVGAWLRNPYPYLLEMPHPQRVIARRIDQFARGLGYDPQRLRAWGLAQAVLSAWWSYEDGANDLETWLEIAELFNPSTYI